MKPCTRDFGRSVKKLKASELRSSVCRILSETIERRASLSPIPIVNGSPPRSVGSIKLNLSAREFNRGYQGCAIEAGTIAKAVSGNANAIEKLKAACEELRLSGSRKGSGFRQGQRAHSTDETLTEGAEHSIKDLLYELSVRVKPRLRPASGEKCRSGQCIVGADAIGTRCGNDPAQVRLRVYLLMSLMSWVRYWFSQGDWPKSSPPGARDPRVLP